MPRRFFLTLPVLFSLLPGPQAADAPKYDASADLKKVNAAVLAVYKSAKDREVARAGPIVLWDGEELTFRYGTYRKVTQVTPPIYHDLKSIAHLPMGVYALLVPEGDGKLTDKKTFAINQFLSTLKLARKAIKNRQLSKEQLIRQEKIIAGCEGVLNDVLKNKTIDTKAIVKSLSEQRPLLYANVNEAAKAQIDWLHHFMMNWKGKLTAAAWDRMIVIVQGSQMPRKDHLAVQYFSKLLKEKGEGKRIIYAEMLFDETKAVNLLGTKLMDTRVGADLFGDPLRMHRDLLGDAAKAYLSKMRLEKEDK